MSVLSKIKTRFVAVAAAAAVATSALCALPAAAAGTYTSYVSTIYSTSGGSMAYMSNLSSTYQSYLSQFSDSGSGTNYTSIGFSTGDLYRSSSTVSTTYLNGSSSAYFDLDNSASTDGICPNYVYFGQIFTIQSPDSDYITSVTFNFQGYWNLSIFSSYATSTGGGGTSTFTRSSFSSSYYKYYDFFVLVYDGNGNLVASEELEPLVSSTGSYSVTLDGFSSLGVSVEFLACYDLASDGLKAYFDDFGSISDVFILPRTVGTISYYYFTYNTEEVSSVDYTSSLTSISGLLSSIVSILTSIRSYCYNIYSQLLDLPTLIYNQFSSDLDTIIDSLSGSGGVTIDFPTDYATSTYQSTISTTASNIYSRLATTNSTLSTISSRVSSAVSGLSDIVDSVTSLPASIWSAFSDGLTGLFVPDADDITDLIDGYDDVILGKLGFVGSVFSYVISLFTAFTSYSSVTSLIFPRIDLSAAGIPFVIEAVEVDLFPSGYDGLQTTCKLITTAIFIFAWCNGVLRFYHSIFSDSVSVE